MIETCGGGDGRKKEAGGKAHGQNAPSGKENRKEEKEKQKME